MSMITLDGLRMQGMRVLFGASLVMAGAVGVVELLRGSADRQMIVLALAGALMVYPCLLLRAGRIDGEARISMSMVVVGMPILLLFAARGSLFQIDLHMVFFAGLAMTAILCDWRAIAASTLVVAVHHLGLGLLMPDWVFYGGGSFARVLLHAVILLSEAAVLIWICHQFVQLLAAVEAEREERVRVEADAARERATRMAELQEGLGVLSNALSALREGRLTTELPDSLPASFSGIRTDFNSALASLRTLVAGVSGSAVHIRESAFSIAGASEELSARSQTTAASLEETAATIASIDERLRASAAAAASTRAEAGRASSAVTEGQRKAEDAVVAMTDVAASAKSINSVMEALDSISFQIRVLAMNIAIEANRVGEAGAGFAVVAELVGQLARRSEEESRNARAQVTSTQTSIEAATATVRGLGSSFAGIHDVVDKVNRLISEMTADNEAQSAAVSEISAAVLAMDRAVQENAAMVVQNSGTCRLLSEEADQLAAQSQSFDIGARTQPRLTLVA